MTNAAETQVFAGSRRVLAKVGQHRLTADCTRQESNDIPQVPLSSMACAEPPHASGAKSGAVGDRPAENAANSDVLAAFVAVLSPEQRAALAKLLGG